MEHIIVNKLKHNPEAIKSCFRISNNMTVVTKDIKIVFLESFLHKELAEIGDVVTLIGLYGIIDENDNYATCIAPGFQKLTVNRIGDTTCDDGNLYKVLYIDKDSVMLESNDLVVGDNQIYFIYDQFYVKGKIPFYISYDQLPKLLSDADIFCGTGLGNDRHVFEILSSIVARGKDKSVYYRNSPEFGKVPPKYTSLSNIYYSLKSSSSKIIGGHYGAGISAAILNPETESSVLENLLMGKGNK